MEFLYKLYDMEYFGIGIFIVITILAFLFLIILFFGKKDEKQRKIEETKQLGLNDLTQESTDLKDITIPEIEQPIIESATTNEEVKEEIPTFETPIETPIILNDAKEENIEQSNQEIGQVIEEINDIAIEPINVEEIVEPNLADFSVPSIEENPIKDVVEPEGIVDNSFEKSQNIFEEPIVEKSNIFDNSQENVILEQKEEPKPAPTLFELPKMATPVKEEIKKEEPNNLESSINKATDFDSLFGDIETETYNINK